MSDPTSPSEGDPITRLLEACLAGPEDEWVANAERTCKEHPDHANELRRRFSMLTSSGLVGPGDANATKRMFGDFELLEVLGQGGMGVVHLARQRGTDRIIALKQIRPELVGVDKARARFRREVDAIARLHHPVICTVYEAGEVNAVPYVAMRYVAGRSLAEHLAEAAADSDATATSVLCDTSRGGINALIHVFEKIAHGLHFAHESGVLHRDIKPGNVMIDREGEPVLLDFGLARPEQSTGDSLTASGDELGTPAYMSPEQISPRPGGLDRRTDIYSLAVTLYECLAGAHPFPVPTRDGLYRSILGGHAPNLRRVCKHLPADLGVVVHMAMAVDRNHRYETAAAFAEDLRRVRHLEPIAARAPSPLQRLTRWAQREPIVAVLVAALLVISGVSAGLSIRAEELRGDAELAKNVAAVEAERARREADTARRVTDFLVGLFKVVDGSTFRGETITAREVLDQGFTRIDAELTDEPAIRARLMNTMGLVYKHLGVFDRAGELFQRALDLRREVGALATEIAQNQRFKAELKHYQGDYVGAETGYRASLATLLAAGIGDHKDVAAALDLTGRARRDQSDLDGAAILHEQARAMRQRLVDDKDGLAESHQSFGMLAIYRGDNAVALREFGAAIDLRRQVFGPQSSYLPELLHGIATAHQNLGDLEAAKVAIQDTLTLSRKVFGAAHHSIGYCESMLGTLAADAGKPAEAIARYQAARSVFEVCFGPHCREVATQIHNLGTVARDTGDYQQALRLLQEGLVIRRELLPPISFDIGVSHADIGTVLERTGDRTTAVASFERALEVWSKLLGDDHARCQWAISRILENLTALGSPATEVWRARLNK